MKLVVLHGPSRFRVRGSLVYPWIMEASRTLGSAGNTPYLTPEQTADLLGCSVGLVRDLLNKGDLKGFRLGRRWRITQEAIDEFIASGGSSVGDQCQ